MLAIMVVFIVSAITSSASNFTISENELSTVTKEPDSAYAITNLKGKYLFSEKCSACHSLNKRAEPDLLQSFEERIPDKKLLYAWIRNSSKVLKSGNPYFNAMYKEYGVMMPDFPELTDQQISDILEYIWQVNHLKKAKNP